MNIAYCLDCYKEINMTPDRQYQFCRACTNKRRCIKCGKTKLNDKHECTFAPITSKCADCYAPIQSISKSNRKVYCDKCGPARGSKKQQAKRVTLKEQFGNRCIKCGYNKCLSALHFHHVEGVKTVSWGKERNVSFTEVAEHPERFELLCANCHAEVHAHPNAFKHLS